MSPLSLSLLGPFSATVDDKPLTSFRTKTAQALIIYLACERGQPQRREHLMALLWPGLPQKSAQANLRQSLYLLKRTIPEVPARTEGETVPLLLAERQTLQLNPEAALALDVDRFQALLTGPEAGWATAVSLYRGHFLADFYLPDSAPFEEWVLARREGLRRQVLSALAQLAGEALAAAALETAELYARRQLEIDSLSEGGHRILMQVLALAGQRTEALSQYETLRQLLARELGAEPSAETAAVYEAILTDTAGRVGGAARADFKPAHTDEIAAASELQAAFPLDGSAPARPVFVGRAAEIERLAGYLAAAADGRGQVAFLAGDAGAGKSSLLVHFAEAASETHKELLVAWGAGNAFSGRGDPYLPFRDALSLLSGDIERAWAAGSLTSEQAGSLWRALPEAIQGISDYAPDLLDTMIPLRSLLARVAAAFPTGSLWRQHLEERAAQPAVPGELEQPQLFEQVLALLRHLARERPLLLLLDDLQWADSGSIALLFHLGRRLAGSNILILGAYRQDEVTAEHPLRPLLDEMRRTHGDVLLDLSQSPGRAFVDAVIDSEPNELDEQFRETLYQRTAGHPMFTVELLRDMQERGDLVQDGDDGWQVGSKLDWAVLPAWVEGVIGSRIGRLAAELREILGVAAVEGEDFTAQVVARVQEIQERRLLQTLSRELEKKHRLVRERSGLSVGQRQLSRYRFAHALFQQYLYNDLSDSERRLLHGDIAAVLEELYEGQTKAIAVQLARHYLEAGEGEKALPYLLEAGDRARTLYAFGEATQHYESALTILKEAGEYERASRILMKLGLTYHNAFDYERSQRAYEEGFALGQVMTPHMSSRDLPRAPHALRLNLHVIPYLDPGSNNEDEDVFLRKQLYSGLVTLTPELDVIPDVAQRWEIYDGGKVYLFHLRDDVRWSDGQPVTAGDFEYAWRIALDPKRGNSNVAKLLFDIAGAEAFFHSGGGNLGIMALDERTLRVELEEPTGYFLQLLTHDVAYPLPCHVVEAYGKEWTQVENFVCNGPFQLVSWEQDNLLFIIERNPYYQGQFAGNVQRIETKIMKEPELAISLYEAEQLDILRPHDFWYHEIHNLSRRYVSDYLTWPFFSTTKIGFDCSRLPFSDRRVRQALVMAVDKQRLIDVHFWGLATPATGGLVPPGMPGHVPNIAYSYDLEAAKSLLAEAGYPGGRGFPPVMALVTKNFSIFMDPVLLHWSSELGIQITREYVEYYGRWSREEVPHIHGSSWGADYPDPDNFLRIGLNSNLSPETVLRWQDVEYSKLLEKAKKLLDQQARMALYRQAQELLVREAPIIPLMYDRKHVLIKPWIKNFRRHKKSLKEIIIEPH